MKDRDNLIRLYSGNEPLISILRVSLEDIGITTLVKNDSITAYLDGSQPRLTDLYIQEKDLEKAEPVVKEFIKKNEPN